MSHGMLVVTWKTCGRNLRLRPKHLFLWVLVPAMHSLYEALSTHLLIQVLAAPVCGGSCHYLHRPRLRERKCVCVCVCVCRVSCANSLPSHGWPTKLLCPWDFPAKNTGAGCHSLLQGIFLTQGSKSHLLHCRQILYQKGNRTAKRWRQNTAPESIFLTTASFPQSKWSLLYTCSG